MNDSLAMAYAMKRRAKKYAEGGEVMDDDLDMVGRIMKSRCYSEGGRVANETDDVADFEPNEFDDLAKDDHLEADYPGSDEIGDAQLDEDEHDMIARIMRSRAKKDKMPRPA